MEEIKKWMPLDFAMDDPVMLWSRVWYEQRYSAAAALVIFIDGMISLTVGSRGSINRFEAINYSTILTANLVLFYYVVLPPITWVMKRFRGRPWMIIEFGTQIYMSLILVIWIC